MINSIITFFIMAAVSVFLSYRKGNGMHIIGFKKGLKSLSSSILIIIVAMLLAEMLSIIVPREMIINLLGTDAGLGGVIIASFLGIFLAIGPMAVFPVMAVLLSMGAGTGSMVALITSWALFSMDQYPFSIAFLGLRFVIRYILTIIPIPFLAGFIAYLIYG